ncbi:MAG: hypothetical protein RLZZ630_590 [Bacteroidota bacterium]
MNAKRAFPDEFLQRMKLHLGDEFEDFIAALSSPSPTSIRLHPQKGNAYFSIDSLANVPWCEHGRYLPERPSFTFDPLFHAGGYYVQEAGSMLIDQLVRQALNGIDDPLVLDLCAAPGGKSTHILSILDGRGTLVSNEINSSRNRILQQNISKWGYANAVVLQNEPAEIMHSGLLYDLIVADVPCSGEGLFRKDPDACLEWNPGSPDACSRRQKKILEDIVPALKPGGFLLYSTCTYSPVENDEQIEKLIDRFGLKVVLPEVPDGIRRTRSGWQAFPHLVKSEGFWCTLLRKPVDQHIEPSRKMENKKFELLKNQKSPALEYLKQNDVFVTIELKGYTWIIPEHIHHIVGGLERTCRIQRAGLKAGEMKGKSFIPDIDIALSVNSSSFVHVLNTDKEQAIRFLQGESMIYNSKEVHEIVLVKHQGLALGWIKNSGKHWSNHYPKEWRIRSRQIPTL